MEKNPIPKCPTCEVKFKPEFPQFSEIKRCKICREFLKTYICEYCDIRREICLKCIKEDSWNLGFKQYWVVFLVVGVCLGVYYFSINQTKIFKDNVKTLRRKYPSQRNETWYNIQSVLQTEEPTVKSIILLHGNERKTCECLTRELVSLFLVDQSWNYEEVTFRNLKNEGKDYGVALEYYRRVAEKFRVLITDLTIVSGNVARIFHWLCDELASDIKPSLFIFTLRNDNTVEHMTPYKRAMEILEKVWKSELASNELHPLLSRIVRNVIDVVPEKQINC